MSYIFISYRRSDSSATATALRQHLVDALGEEAVYHDVIENTPGVRYPDKLRDALSEANVVLVLIGKDWLSATNEWNQRRIDFEDDWVRLEIFSSLGRADVSVIPVLIDEAKMPPAEALPTSIAELSYRQFVTLRHSEWEASVGNLITALGVSKKDFTVEKSHVSTLSIEDLRNVIRTELPLILHFSPIVEEILRVQILEANGIEETNIVASLNLQLNRLVGRLIRNVDATICSAFPYQFTVDTNEGRWKGYANYYKSHANGEVDELNRCILILPDSSGRISGVAATLKVILGYNPRGIAPTSVKAPHSTAGVELGLVIENQYDGRFATVVLSESERYSGLHSTFGF